MPILLLAVASVATAWIRGVSPLGLGRVHIRWIALPPLSFLLQWIVLIRTPGATILAAPLVQLLSGAWLLAFAWANRRYRGMLGVALGTLLNLLVVSANGGYMPVRLADVERIGFHDIAAQMQATGHFQKSGVLDERTILPSLADVIYVPLPIGPGRMISIGDILVATGTFVLLQEALMATRGELRNGRLPSLHGDDAEQSRPPQTTTLFR